MQTVVVYKSVFHSTEQYARWLAESLGAELLPMSKAGDVARFDRVVVMSGTYAGGMPLVGYLKKQWAQLQGKDVIAIGVGALPPEHEGSKISYERIPEEIRTKIHFFHIQGATPFAGKEKREQEIRKEYLDEVLNALCAS